MQIYTHLYEYTTKRKGKRQWLVNMRFTTVYSDLCPLSILFTTHHNNI